MLAGHFDVVAPEPDESQFTPRIEGDYLWGRGAADMKTVVATYLVWMKERARMPAPYPRLNLLLVSNEEQGESDPMGTGHILTHLNQTFSYQPDLLIAGERTEESGSLLTGEICTQNRGVVRFTVTARGQRAHSGMNVSAKNVLSELIRTRDFLEGTAENLLTLESKSGWHSQIRFPFLNVGEEGVFNITPERGVMGVEIRTIPEDDVQKYFEAISSALKQSGLEISDIILEGGITCPADNPWLDLLVKAVGKVSGKNPVIGRKLAGTSARFAPGNQGVVWGQSGLHPHGIGERHFIPSIEPYYNALSVFAESTTNVEQTSVS